MGFELAGVSWSEFAAGTIRAQLGHFGVESRGLNLAETPVRSVPGEGLEPSRGKPSQDFKSWKWDFQIPVKSGQIPSLLNRNFGLSELE